MDEVKMFSCNIGGNFIEYGVSSGCNISLGVIGGILSLIFALFCFETENRFIQKRLKAFNMTFSSLFLLLGIEKEHIKSLPQSEDGKWLKLREIQDGRLIDNIV